MDVDVLVVDDEAGIRKLLSRLVAEAGATCRAVGTGEEGLELLRAGDRFRLLLVDYRLDGMDGIQFLEAARQLDPRAVRVLFTGDGRPQIAQDATLRAQVSYFLVKPVGPEVLRQVFREALQPPGRPEPAPASRAAQAYQKQHLQQELDAALARVKGLRGR